MSHEERRRQLEVTHNARPGRWCRRAGSVRAIAFAGVLFAAMGAAPIAKADTSYSGTVSYVRTYDVPDSEQGCTTETGNENTTFSFSNAVISAGSVNSNFVTAALSGNFYEAENCQPFDPQGDTNAQTRTLTTPGTFELGLELQPDGSVALITDPDSVANEEGMGGILESEYGGGYESAAPVFEVADDPLSMGLEGAAVDVPLGSSSQQVAVPWGFTAAEGTALGTLTASISATPGSVPAPPAPTPPAPTPPAPAPPAPAPPKPPVPKLALAARPTLSKLSQTLADVLDRGKLSATCALAGAGKCTVKATIPARTAKRLGLKLAPKTAKTYTLGTASKTFLRQGKATLVVKLRRATVAALKDLGKLTVTISASSSRVNRRTRTSAKTVTLR